MLRLKQGCGEWNCLDQQPVLKSSAVSGNQGIEAAGSIAELLLEKNAAKPVKMKNTSFRFLVQRKDVFSCIVTE